MAQYYKKQHLNVYIVSASPIGFWRKRIKLLPYNVGQKVELEVSIESNRERGLALMDLTYFEFVEITPDGQKNIIKVDEKRVTFDKHKGIIYPLDTQPISREGVIEWRLVDTISHDEVLLFADSTVFLHSSKDAMRYVFGVIGFSVGIIATLLAQWVLAQLQILK